MIVLSWCVQEKKEKKKKRREEDEEEDEEEEEDEDEDEDDEADRGYDPLLDLSGPFVFNCQVVSVWKVAVYCWGCDGLCV